MFKIPVFEEKHHVIKVCNSLTGLILIGSNGKRNCCFKMKSVRNIEERMGLADPDPVVGIWNLGFRLSAHSTSMVKVLGCI